MQLTFSGRRRQKGAGLIAWGFYLGLIALAAIIATKSIPVYLNQMKVARSVKQVANEGSNAELELVQMHRELESRWDVEDIKILHFRQVKIKQLPNGPRALTYDYEARVHLFYNIYLVFHFKDEVPLRRLSS